MWIFKERDTESLETSQMNILRPLLCITRLDKQQNTDIRKGFKVLCAKLKGYQRPGYSICRE